MNKVHARAAIIMLLNLFIQFILFLIASFTSESSPIISGLILVAYAITGYFVLVFSVAERNWLDIRAIFHAAWSGTIGLSAFRLTEYQEPWQTKTWIWLAIAYCLFEIDATVGLYFGKGFQPKFLEILDKVHIGKLHLELRENRLFAICVITTLIGLACLVVNIINKGYIPCFSNSTSAYVNFHSKYQIFAAAASIAAGLCFYTIKTQKLSLFKNIVLILCILYLVIIYPILIVSRGMFITAALSLATAIFYTCGKKLWVLCLSLVLIAGVYMSVSTLRNYTDAQLEDLFEPAEIEIDNNSDDEEDEDDNKVVNVPTFKLSPKMAFLYGYLTVSHDNFNLAIKNVEGYTWGARQMEPFNIVLKSELIENTSKNGEKYLVRPHLNTVNFIGDAYYDFHEIGIIVLMLFWSTVFGIIQAFYVKSKKGFSLLTLCNTMTPVTMCFFASWMSNFTHWLLWGTTLILFFACTLTIKKSKH